MEMKTARWPKGKKSMVERIKRKFKKKETVGDKIKKIFKRKQVYMLKWIVIWMVLDCLYNIIMSRKER